MNKLVEDIDKLIAEAGEGESYKLESLIRALLADEELATSHYRKAAQIAKDKNFTKLEQLFNDLADEEIVHIYELNRALELVGLDANDVLIKKGTKEVDTIFGHNLQNNT